MPFRDSTENGYTEYLKDRTVLPDSQEKTQDSRNFLLNISQDMEFKTLAFSLNYTVNLDVCDNQWIATKGRERSWSVMMNSIECVQIK